MAEFLNPRPQFFDDAGLPLDSGEITFLTTSTLVKKDIFTDINLSIAAANPVVLDGSGVIPLRYLDGSYRIQIHGKRSSTGVQGTLIDDLDPIGGNPTLFGALGTWNSVVIYSINNTVIGSDGLFYISLANSNLANNPITPSPTKWSEIRFLGVYNASDSYSIGDVVQESTGLMWRSVVNTNTGNTPSSDDGTNWLSATNDNWIPKSSDFTIIMNQAYIVDGSGGTVDMALPAAVVAKQWLAIHNESISTNVVKITNTGAAFTIKGPKGTVTTADNLVIPAGRTAYLIAKTTLILETA